VKVIGSASAALAIFIIRARRWEKREKGSEVGEEREREREREREASGSI
jgi:hypothetical protein